MATRPTNHDWLALTTEPPLDPELPICDPHQSPVGQVGTRGGRATSSTRFSSTSAPVTTSCPPCSSSVARCTGAARPTRSARGRDGVRNGIAAMSASGLYGHRARGRRHRRHRGSPSRRESRRRARAHIARAAVAFAGSVARGVGSGPGRARPSHETGFGSLPPDDFRPARAARAAPADLRTWC